MDAALFAERLSELKRQQGLHPNSQLVHSNLASSFWIRKIINNPLALKPSQLRLLRKTGFVFSYTDTLWIDHYLALATFREKHGHCNVPTHSNRHERLGKWVSRQRISHREGKLSLPRQKALQNLGMVWDLEELSWKTHVQELKAFIRKRGHTRVPTHTGTSLGTWVGNMRNRVNELSPSKKRQLDDLGFVWKPFEEAWEAGLKELKKFHAKYGHGNAPARSKTYPKAGVLVQRARLCYHEGTLNQNRIRQLESLKVDWSPTETLWKQRFEELKAVGKRLGHFRLPKGWPENKTLERWARNQRERFHRLPKEKRMLLHKIGFFNGPQN